MRAMILAAGKGERMRPLTLIKPKPLLEVHGTTLIEHHLINLKRAGFERVVINISWLGQQIMQKLGSGEQYGLDIRYSSEGPEPLETGGGMLKALPLIGEEPFLVVNGDVKTDFNFESLFQKNIEGLVHLVLVDNPEHNPKGDFCLHADEGLLTLDPQPRFTYSGVGIYDPALLSNCKPGTFSVTPLIKDAIEKQQVTGQRYRGAWDDIGTIDRLTAINMKGHNS